MDFHAKTQSRDCPVKPLQPTSTSWPWAFHSYLNILPTEVHVSSLVLLPFCIVGGLLRPATPSAWGSRISRCQYGWCPGTSSVPSLIRNHQSFAVERSPHLGPQIQLREKRWDTLRGCWEKLNLLEKGCNIKVGKNEVLWIPDACTKNNQLRSVLCWDSFIIDRYQKIIEHYKDIQYTDMCKLFFLRSR